jgi:hypothetical protein
MCGSNSKRPPLSPQEGWISDGKPQRFVVQTLGERTNGPEAQPSQDARFGGS